MRQIRDAAGVEWMVYQVDPATNTWRVSGTLPEDYRKGWLCFECPNEKRRLTPLPAGWEEYSSEQLGSLIGNAVPVRSAKQSTA
jgi:hypothetical protein